jgi:hypothetical protein
VNRQLEVVARCALRTVSAVSFAAAASGRTWQSSDGLDLDGSGRDTSALRYANGVRQRHAHDRRASLNRDLPKAWNHHRAPSLLRHLQQVRTTRFFLRSSSFFFGVSSYFLEGSSYFPKGSSVSSDRVRFFSE